METGLLIKAEKIKGKMVTLLFICTKPYIFNSFIIGETGASTTPGHVRHIKHADKDMMLGNIFVHYL